MKQFFTLLFLGASLFASSQNEIIIDFTHMMGDQPFAIDVEGTQTNGNPYTFTRCEFYLSQISIVHDGG